MENTFVNTTINRYKLNQVKPSPSEKNEKKSKHPILINTGIVSGTTLTGAGIAGGLSYHKEFKNIKMGFAGFAKEKFKQIAKNSQKDEMIYGYKSGNKLRYYFKEIKQIKKELKLMTEELTPEMQKVKRGCQLALYQFNLYVTNIKVKFIEEVINEKIWKIAKNSTLGAALGLAGGVSIIGAKYFYNKKKEASSDKRTI